MAVSIREQILALLADKVSRISVANGYEVDVQEVVRWPTIQTARAHPFVIVAPGDETAAPERNMEQQCRILTVQFELWTLDDGTGADSGVNQLLAAIEKCVLQDPQLEEGGAPLCEWPEIADVLPLLSESVQEAGALLTMNFYYTTVWDDPYLPGG